MDEIGRDDVGMEADAGGRAEIGELLVDHRVVAIIEAEAAIFLRYGRAEQPRLAGLAPEGLVDLALLLPAIEMRRQLAIEELADGIAKLVVILVERGAAGKIEHVRLP